MKCSAFLVALAAVGLMALTPSIKEAMKTIVEPASNTLFSVGGEVDPANGPDGAKTPDARWRAGADAAGKLKSVGLAMQSADAVRPGEDWIKSAKAMAEISDAAEAAAKAKDGAKLAQAANDLGDTCTACHTRYKPKA